MEWNGMEQMAKDQSANAMANKWSAGRMRMSNRPEMIMREGMEKVCDKRLQS